MLGVLIHYVRNQVAAGKIRRNSAIGIRTKATMSSDAAWEAGHARAAPLLAVTFVTAYALGAITVLIGLVSALADIDDAAVLVVPLGGILVFLGLLSTAAARANAAARATGRPSSR
ncbi:SdpI family protein [Streptomyces sp. NBC_01725]|uniref:SdpI family protein n=1 Tax=Streptomyces sp. NBC_01725 TaxID=2975923 RepID=UPI002E2DC70B|nr:SdpI family protein [Streptomyces sp. NBC_01725]